MGLAMKHAGRITESGEEMELGAEPTTIGSQGTDSSSGDKTLVPVGDNKEIQTLITEDTRRKTQD